MTHIEVRRYMFLIAIHADKGVDAHLPICIGVAREMDGHNVSDKGECRDGCVVAKGVRRPAHCIEIFKDYFEFLFLSSLRELVPEVWQESFIVNLHKMKEGIE